MCSHIGETVHACLYVYTCTCMETRHILRRPRGEAKGLGELGNKAISRIPKLINCPPNALYPYSTADPQYSIGLCGAPRTILIVSHTHGQTGHKAPGFIAPLNFGVLGTCYSRHRGFTRSLLKPNTYIMNPTEY